MLESWVTEEDVRVLFVARRSIPIVDLNIDFEAGSGYDPAGKAGLSEMVASLLLTGQKRYADLPAMREEEAENAFDEIGAKIAADAQADRIAVGLRSLSQPVLLERAVLLLCAALCAPSWAPRPFEREKERLIAFAEEQLSDPEQLCNLRLTQALYGRHPFGIVADERSVAAIERRDAIDFHRGHFVRQRAIVTLVGDLSREDAERVAARIAAALPDGRPASALPAVKAVKPTVKRIDHPASQAHIAIGALTPGVADADYFPLMIANRMFSWQLSEVVREQQGLAYEVSSALFASRLGEHRIALKTRRDQANQALDAVQQTLARFVRDGVDADEFRRTRTELIDGRALALDANAKLVRQAADIAFDGLPLAYFETWVEQVAAVDLSAALATFARWIDPTRQTTIIVGAGREHTAEETTSGSLR